MTLDPEQLRQAMRAWTTGVAVVTTTYEGKQHGMTVNSFTSVSLDPPLVSVSMKRSTYTHQLVEKAGEFALTILSREQDDISDRFAGKLPDLTDRFEGLETETLEIDAPLFRGGLAYLNCRVVNSVSVGENTLFIAEVIAAQGNSENEPLVYHNRVFWKLVK